MFSLEGITLPDLDTFLDLLNEKRGDSLRQIGGQLTSYVFSLLDNRDSSQSYVFEELESKQLERANLDSSEIVTAFEFESKGTET